MADFRLEVFYTVAKRLSFTKAAAELFITQPAVTKHIHELEEGYKNKLFERYGNKIKLTPAGKLLMQHAEDVFEIYRNIEFDMNTMVKQQQGSLRLGASTTISQYVIPPLLAGFRNKFPDIDVSLINGNTEQIEQALLTKDIELGIIEGRSKHQEISYLEFINDEIVLVCSKDHPLAGKARIKSKALKENRFVMREQGSGTLEVIEHALKPLNIKLNELQIDIHLGSTESIKSYLLYANCLAFISVYAVARELQNGSLQVIDVEGLTIERKFYFIHLKGKTDGISDIFLKHCYRSHNLK